MHATIVIAANVVAARAQTTRVAGVAYDSLRDAPLKGAIVMIADLARSAITDSNGRFAMDSVRIGPHTFTLFHDAVDSLGLSGITRSVVIASGGDEVVLAIPSFVTLWRRFCDAPPPRDSGLLIGSIRDAGRRTPIVGATVDVRWTELSVERGAAVAQGWGGAVRSDSRGSYTICGIPPGVTVRASAVHDSSQTPWITIDPASARVLRRDLVIAPRGVPLRPGVVMGTVRDATGSPANARVSVDTLAEARTDSGGHFVVRNVPPGTRVVTSAAIGAAPVEHAVNVFAGDTVTVDLTLEKVTTLGPTVVTAPSVRRRMLSDLEERRTLGVGHFMDSTALTRHASLRVAISMMADARDACYWIDGLEVEPQDVTLRDLQAVAVVETHRSSDPTIPMQYRLCRSGPGNARRRTPRVVVLIWTKNWLP